LAVLVEVDQLSIVQNYKDFGGATLDPIAGENIETGIKGEFFGGRLNVSAAIFKIKHDKLAPEAFHVGGKAATSKGFEFELSGELVKGLSATVG